MIRRTVGFLLFLAQYLFFAYAIGSGVMFGLRLIRFAGVEGGGGQVGASLAMLTTAFIAAVIGFGVSKLRRRFSSKRVDSIQVR